MSNGNTQTHTSDIFQLSQLQHAMDCTKQSFNLRYSTTVMTVQEQLALTLLYVDGFECFSVFYTSFGLYNAAAAILQKVIFNLIICNFFHYYCFITTNEVQICWESGGRN